MKENRTSTILKIPSTLLPASSANWKISTVSSKSLKKRKIISHNDLTNFVFMYHKRLF